MVQYKVVVEQPAKQSFPPMLANEDHTCGIPKKDGEDPTLEICNKPSILESVYQDVVFSQISHQKSLQAVTEDDLDQVHVSCYVSSKPPLL